MPESEIRDALKAFICRELLGNPNYHLEDQQPLITGGLIDSFSLAQIGVFVEDAFDIYIPDNDLTVANMDTLDQMVQRIIADLKP
jgi:acyl carrier protein